MKKIIFICCIALFVLLTGCKENTSIQSTEIDTPITASKTEEEPTTETDDNKAVNVDETEIHGKWTSSRGTPVIFNSDGTAESISVNMRGNYTINGDKLKIYWDKNNRTEIWKIKKTDGKITLEYGEAPLVAIYEKE